MGHDRDTESFPIYYLILPMQFAMKHRRSTHHVLSKSVMEKIGALVLAQISSRPVDGKKLRPSCSPAVRVLLAQCPFDGFNAATIQELRLREFTQLLQDLAAATRYWLLERSS
jgi:hypothetical protein